MGELWKNQTIFPAGESTGYSLRTPSLSITLFERMHLNAVIVHNLCKWATLFASVISSRFLLEFTVESSLRNDVLLIWIWHHLQKRVVSCSTPTAVLHLNYTEPNYTLTVSAGLDTQKQTISTDSDLYDSASGVCSSYQYLISSTCRLSLSNSLSFIFRLGGWDSS